MNFCKCLWKDRHQVSRICNFKIWVCLAFTCFSVQESLNSSHYLDFLEEFLDYWKPCENYWRIEIIAYTVRIYFRQFLRVCLELTTCENWYKWKFMQRGKFLMYVGERKVVILMLQLKGRIFKSLYKGFRWQFFILR